MLCCISDDANQNPTDECNSIRAEMYVVKSSRTIKNYKYEALAHGICSGVFDFFTPIDLIKIQMSEMNDWDEKSHLSMCVDEIIDERLKNLNGIYEYVHGIYEYLLRNGAVLRGSLKECFLSDKKHVRYYFVDIDVEERNHSKIKSGLHSMGYIKAELHSIGYSDGDSEHIEYYNKGKFKDTIMVHIISSDNTTSYHDSYKCNSLSYSIKTSYYYNSYKRNLLTTPIKRSGSSCL